MDEQTWYFRDSDGVIMGPFTPEQMGDLVRARHIEDDTPISASKRDWSPASEFPPFPVSPPESRARKKSYAQPTIGRGRSERVVVPASVWTAFVLLSITAVIGFVAYMYYHLNARELVTPPRSAMYEGAAHYARKANELRQAMLLYIAAAMVQAALALFLLRGYEWARIAVAILLTISLIGRIVLPGPGTLLGIVLDLIIVLCVLNPSARAYARQTALLRAQRRLIR